MSTTYIHSNIGVSDIHHINVVNLLGKFFLFLVYVYVQELFEENRLWHLLIDSCQERPTLQTLDGVKMVLPFIACMVDVMYML
jgi:hypothetical protein